MKDLKKGQILLNGVIGKYITHKLEIFPVTYLWLANCPKPNQKS